MESYTGKLLVASSLVDDPIYAGGVGLVVHQDETSVIGVMLNRPMKPSPEALMALLGDSDAAKPSSAVKNRLSADERPSQDGQAGSDSDDGGRTTSPESPSRMLHFGGPLSGPVVAIHQSSQYAEAETGSGIYVAAQKHHLEHLMRRQSGPYRLIVGHLGWAPDQLETEIEAGYWHVVPATVDTVFSSASEMWPQLIRRATSNSLARWIGVDDVVGVSELN